MASVPGFGTFATLDMQKLNIRLSGKNLLV